MARMLPRALLLAAAAATLPCCQQDIGNGDTTSIVTVRVSTGHQELQGNDDSINASISGNGRFVVFESVSTNLTEGDSNGFRDIFLKDRWTGQIFNLTNTSDLSLTQDDCFNPSISADGRFVAFESSGDYAGITNFVPPPDPPVVPAAQRTRYVYVIDRKDKVCRPAFDATSMATIPDGYSGTPKLSADGRYLAFISVATNLVAPAPTANRAHVYICDFGANYSSRTITLVSHADSVATEANGISFEPSISGDGTRIAFTSAATDLVTAGDSDAGADVYLWESGTVTLISSVQPSGAGVLSIHPALSLDGTTVCYMHRDPAALISQYIQVCTVGGATEDIASSHRPGTFDRMAISGDGRTVFFLDSSSPLAQLWSYDRVTGIYTEISVSSFGVEGNRNSLNVTVSGNGRWAAWDSTASTLAGNDTNGGGSDIFVRGPLR